MLAAVAIQETAPSLTCISRRAIARIGSGRTGCRSRSVTRMRRSCPGSPKSCQCDSRQRRGLLGSVAAVRPWVELLPHLAGITTPLTAPELLDRDAVAQSSGRTSARNAGRTRLLCTPRQGGPIRARYRAHCRAVFAATRQTGISLKSSASSPRRSAAATKPPVGCAARPPACPPGNVRLHSGHPTWTPGPVRAGREVAIHRVVSSLDAHLWVRSLCFAGTFGWRQIR